jgi:hypothetical protein
MVQDTISSTLYTDVFPALLVPTAPFLGKPYKNLQFPQLFHAPMPVSSLLYNLIDGRVA